MRLLTNYITLTLLVLLLLYTAIYNPILRNIMGILTYIVILLALVYANRVNKVFASTMMIVGVFFLIYRGESVHFWFESVMKNLPLVSLIVLAPMLAIPVKLGQYDQNINHLILKYAKKPRHLYFFISMVYFILSPILNLGAIHLIHSIIGKLKLPKKFLGRVYIRGFFSVSAWAPYFASVFLVIYFLEIPLNDYVPYGLILGVMQIIVSNFLYICWEEKEIQFDLANNKGKINRSKIFEFITVFTLLISTIFLLEELVEINIIIIITVVILFFTMVWSAYLKQLNQLIIDLKYFFHHIIPRSANEIVIFLSAGFFGAVISNTYLGDVINILWHKIADVSVFLMSIITILTIAFFSFLGIHQIVTISIILTSVTYELAGISDMVMAMVLLSSYAIGATLSPVSPANILVANIIKANIYHLIIRYNLLFALLVCIIHSLLIYMVFLIF